MANQTTPFFITIQHPPSTTTNATNTITSSPSAVAGSSGAAGRGSGVVIPFYELFFFVILGAFSAVRKDG